MTLISRFIKNDSGATAIEYGLIAALISIAAIVVMGTIGTGLVARFTTVSNALNGAAAGS